MANGPDFRFRSQFPIAGVAQLLANKPVKEEQIKLQVYVWYCAIILHNFIRLITKGPAMAF